MRRARKDSKGNKGKRKEERATTEINYRRATTEPKAAADKEPCGKRTERKRKDFSSGPQGNSVTLSSQNQTDTGPLPRVPPSLVIHSLKFELFSVMVVQREITNDTGW